MKKHIIISGNIGAGKSTLVKLLAEQLHMKPFWEPVQENPYLEDFYGDMKKWAFHSQLFFLTNRLEMHHSLKEMTGSVVQDRSVYEDAEIFAENLYKNGFMNERDYQTYRNFYELLIQMLPKPDLLVYLKASIPTLQKHIAIRARAMESTISASYLEDLNTLYTDFIAGYQLSPLVVIDMDKTDFVQNPSCIEAIIESISEKLKSGQGELF
jgi:deoxyadenosine/deoxycytidine kinase